MNPRRYPNCYFLLLSADPPVIYLHDWALRRPTLPLRVLLEILRYRRATILVTPTWSCEKPGMVERLAVQIARQLCAGVAAAHEQGILHRDLKPANVMLDGRGRVKITDFGLAGLAEGFQGAEVRAGTPTYMAPEQLAGKQVTTRSDIFALGLVLYALFTGRRAYEA